MNETQKDELLQMLLQTLATRGLAVEWASVQKPYSGLVEESRNLLSVNAHLEEFRIYLQSNPIIQDSVETLLSHLAMSANAKWQDTPAVVRPLAQRGWHLGRWLPTFLIIDGPLGRFLKDSNSPLNSILKKEYSKYPLLTQARDIFNNDLFRLVRNGVGHWAFYWDEQKDGLYLEMVDWKTGKSTARISVIEGEALHLVAFSVIEVFDKEMFSRANPKKNGG